MQECKLQVFKNKLLKKTFDPSEQLRYYTTRNFVVYTGHHVDQGSAIFSLPRAALAIHIFVEGCRKKLIMPWTETETISLTPKVQLVFT
jgi:hypothetical protein